MTREELWLAAIAGLDGVNPPDYPVWHYEQMLAAIYDAVVGAVDPRPFPERSWHLDEFLWAVYCAVAGLADPGIPAPTCRIEEFWQGIYLKAMNDEDAAVPTPVWRIEEFLAEVFNNLTTAELKTVTGTMLHVLDALAKPAEELLVDLSPIQDLHGYSQPWPAGGGVNKLKTTDITAGKVAFGLTSAISGEYVRFTGTCSSGGGHTWKFATVNADQRTLVASLNLKGFFISGGSGLAITDISYNAADYTVSISMGGLVTNTVYDFTVGIVAYEGSTAPASWSPYSNICPISGRTGLSVYVSPTQDVADATTYAVDWTSQAGTVYGGTLDVVTGVLTVDRAMLLYDGSPDENITLQSINSYGIANFNMNGGVNLPNYKGGINNFINNRFDYQTTTIANTQTEGMFINSAGSAFLRIKSSVASTVAELKTWLASSNLQVCYELATPLTYQLSAQEVQMLLGENYVWASSGDTVSVTYYAEGNANPLQSLNILLGGNYSNPKTADDVSDKEALEIILGGNK